MKPWRISLSTGCFYGRSIFEVLEPIRQHGFDTIEVCSFPAHLDYHDQELLERAALQVRGLGLDPLSFHAPFADAIDITALDPKAREATVKELISACHAAARMGVKHVVLHPGPERAGRPAEDEFDVRMRHAAESLHRVAASCREAGIHLLLENMLPHLLFGPIGDMLVLLEGIAPDGVGACLDTGHAYLARELGTVVHHLASHLQVVHVNDNRGERDEHLAPGDGHIDWAWFLHELRQRNFNGTLVLELSSREGETVDEMLGRAAHAREYLKSLMNSMP